MSIQEIKLSPEFKTQTTRAISTIVLFVVTYLLILLLTLGLTGVSVYFGLMLIATLPGFLTLVVGAGLASFGVLILIFLVKFMFTENKVDRSHLREIKKADEPELFKMIDEIVRTVGTNFPKKIYLSGDVNAAVFYDSSFRSMFFPVKKNLQIGIGLVNTVTQAELKAILSHEFGHFSQKTMKVGSYVYNVNQVIFNMLYDNNSYHKLIHQWANINAFISLFVVVAVKLIEGIQWVLKKMYEVVNRSYMALSREMEFHADEIAANVTGYEPLKDSLQRMSLADHAFNTVLSFYGGKIAENQKSENIYLEQTYVLNFLAEENAIPILNGLPHVSLQELNKFNKSKLVIKDQWASHPDTDERIERLEKTGITAKEQANGQANDLFRDIEKTQKDLTNTLFKGVTYTGEPAAMSLESFQTDFRCDFVKNSFAKVYNSYYDSKNPLPFDIDLILAETTKTETFSSLQDLFSDARVDLVYTAVALNNDSEVLKQIVDKSIPVKTFDYEGRKYGAKESRVLLADLQAGLEQANEAIKQNDIEIFTLFHRLERAAGGKTRLADLYRAFFACDETYLSKYEIYTQLSNELQFINFTTPFDQIRRNLLEAGRTETKLRMELMVMLEDPVYQSEITKEMRENLDLYLSKEWMYFVKESYIDKNLEMLYTAMNNYAFLLARGYFLLKKSVLDYQEGLIKNSTEMH